MLLEGGATAASLALAGTVAFKWIRPKFPISVNCWFCQEDQSVPYDCRNAWVCGGCQQYNGFNKDGDYNRDIPEMHRDVSIVGTQRMGKTTTPSVPDNGLCATCNLHQELKIHQLAKFVPLNAWDYDREIEDYSAHLNRTYRLCRSCKCFFFCSVRFDVTSFP